MKQYVYVFMTEIFVPVGVVVLTIGGLSIWVAVKARRRTARMRRFAAMSRGMNLYDPNGCCLLVVDDVRLTRLSGWTGTI